MMAVEQRLYRSVLEKMLSLIDSGEFPVNGRLPPERELAERFEVSRPTIREAIIALESLGRVQVKTGSGIYVLEHQTSLCSQGIEHISPFELTEARALIESEAAALAAILISDEELTELKHLMAEMAEEVSNDNTAGIDSIDEKFHRVIAQATRNAMLVSLIEHLWYVRNNTPRVYDVYMANCVGKGKRTLKEHQDIYEAMARRDSNAARTAMNEHFASLLNNLIETTEATQIEQARKQAQEVRERFSLGRLANNTA